MIKIGTDSSYPPNEFLAADGKTVEGFEVDLFNAVAQKFGVKAAMAERGLRDHHHRVLGKKYDMGVSSFTINDERKQQVTMVSYFEAGTQWATAKGNPKGVDPDNACGKTVAVQANTVQDTDDLPVRQKKCGSNKINILEGVPGPSDQRRRVRRTPCSLITDRRIRRETDERETETLGDIYEAAPYGVVIPKDQTEFGQATVEALNEMNADGSYKAAPEKWGVEQGAITDFAEPMTATMTEPPSRMRSGRANPRETGPPPMAMGGHCRDRRAGVDVPQLVVLQPGISLVIRVASHEPEPGDRGFWKGHDSRHDLLDDLRCHLGVILAIMRLSDNPVLRGVSWLYTWFFRAIPRYVLLTIMGALSLVHRGSVTGCRSTGRSSNGWDSAAIGALGPSTPTRSSWGSRAGSSGWPLPSVHG